MDLKEFAKIAAAKRKDRRAGGALAGGLAGLMLGVPMMKYLHPMQGAGLASLLGLGGAAVGGAAGRAFERKD